VSSKFRDSGQRVVGFEGDRPVGFDDERASADCQIPRWGLRLGPDRCLDPDHRWTPSSLFPLGSPVPAGGAAAAKSEPRTMAVFSFIVFSGVFFY